MQLDEIIAGCRRSERKSQDELVRLYAPRLMAVCSRYSRDRESAKDALQESFINIFRYIDSYSEQGSFEGWMRRIAVNCALSFSRKNKKFDLIPITDYQSVDNVEMPEAYANLQLEDLKKLIEKLPDNLLMVFNLYVVDGYKHKEIAVMLGIAESSSRAALSRARIKLIEIISKEKEKDFFRSSLIVNGR